MTGYNPNRKPPGSPAGTGGEFDFGHHSAGPADGVLIGTASGDDSDHFARAFYDILDPDGDTADMSTDSAEHLEDWWDNNHALPGIALACQEKDNEEAITDVVHLAFSGDITSRDGYSEGTTELLNHMFRDAPFNDEVVSWVDPHEETLEVRMPDSREFATPLTRSISTDSPFYDSVRRHEAEFAERFTASPTWPSVSNHCVNLKALATDAEAAGDEETARLLRVERDWWADHGRHYPGEDPTGTNTPRHRAQVKQVKFIPSSGETVTEVSKEDYETIRGWLAKEGREHDADHFTKTKDGNYTFRHGIGYDVVDTDILGGAGTGTTSSRFTADTGLYFG